MLASNEVNDRSKGFYQVIRQIECVELTAMMNPYSGNEASSHQRPGNKGTNDRVPIVQGAVEGVVASTVKTRMQKLKVLTSRGSFGVALVAGQDASRISGNDLRTFKAGNGQGARLIRNLLFDDALPNLVA